MRIELGEVRLAPALSIAGVVQTESGASLGRLKLVLRGADADSGFWNDARRNSELDSHVAKRQGRSDERGRFVFGDLAAGTYRLEVFRAGHNDPVIQEVVLAEGRSQSDLTVVVPEGLALEGFVRDQHGKGLANSLVSIEPEFSEDCGLDVLTDAEGHFLARDVPPGAYRLRPGSVPPSHGEPERFFMLPVLEHVQAGQRDIELVFEEGDWVRGRVLESDGLPASNFFVASYDASGRFLDRIFCANESSFRIGVARGIACTLCARPEVPVGSFPDPDDAHAARLKGVVSGGAELVLELPPR